MGKAGKIFGTIVIVLGLYFIIANTLGSVVDLTFDTMLGFPNWDIFLRPFGIDFLNWRYFVVMPLWLLSMVICIIIILIGISIIKPKETGPMDKIREFLASKTDEEKDTEETAGE